MLLLPVVVMLTLLSATASAALIVSKSLDKDAIEAGDNLTITLKLSNTFEDDVTVNMQDENIVGSAGLIIDCLERKIGAGKEVTINYPSIHAYSVGQFTLGKAKVTYTNPQTGQAESVQSNTLNLEVSPSKANTFGTRETMIRIYECQGVKSQSTSYSASITSTHFKEGSAPEDGKMLFSGQSTLEDANSPTMVSPLEKVLYKNPEFMERHNEILSQGFVLVSKKIKNIDESTGKFEYDYRKDNRSLILTGIIDQSRLEQMHVSDSVSMFKRYGLLILITLLIFFVVWFFTRESEFDKSLLKRKRKTRH